MKLKSFLFAAPLFLFLFIAAGCKKETPVETSLSRKELLTKTSWLVSKATDLSSTPGQPQDITNTISLITLTFTPEGLYNGSGQSGTWELADSDTKIIFDKNAPAQMIADILELSLDKLQIKINIPALIMKPMLCDVTFVPNTLTQMASEYYFVNKTESRHFVYYYSKGDNVDTLTQENYFTWLLNELKETPAAKINYFKYKNLNDMISVTGKAVNGWADPPSNLFHSVWSSDHHECVHVVVGLKIGQPCALFSEGMAVAHSADLVNGKYIPLWHSVGLNDIMQYLKKNGQLPSMDNLVASEQFRKLPEEITYPVAGAFVRFVLDKYGLDNMKTFIRLGSYIDSAETVKSNFKKIYGKELGTVWNEWINAIDGAS